MSSIKPGKLNPRTFFIPAGLLVAALIIVFLIPAEATIGEGIRIVAIHVALIWAGMFGLLVTGFLGFMELLRPNAKLNGWLEDIALVSLVLFALGVGTSLIAEIVNWGGIAWNEPRTAANLNLLAFAIIAQVIASWLGRPRLQGGIRLVVAVAVVWITAVTELQLHPSGAVNSSPSVLIRLSFYGLALCCLLLAAWAVWFIRSRRMSPIFTTHKPA